jgi:carotenoid cleavage dioxygenase-like enzyme
MSVDFDLLRSLTKSNQEPVQTAVRGEIPRWLHGTLFRNGPGRYEYGNNKSHKHFFDGHACVHKFTIKNGGVVYSNHFLETKSFTSALTANRLYPVFGTADLCSSLFGRLKMFFELPETFDNVNVNISPFGKQILQNKKLIHKILIF